MTLRNGFLLLFVTCVTGIVQADEVTTFTYDFQDGVHTDSVAVVTNPSPYVLAGGYNAEMNNYTPQTPRRSGIEDAGGGDLKAFSTLEWMVPNGSYQTFSISTADSMSVIRQLDSISFELSTFGLNAFSTGTQVSVEVLASLDGFSSSTSLGMATIQQTENFQEPDPVLANIDLTSFNDFQNLTNQTIDFRMFWTTTDLGSNFIRGRIDDVALTVTSDVIPEPATALITGLMSLALIVRRRR